MIRKLACLAAVSALLGACSSDMAMDDSAPMTGMPAPTMAADYVMMAGASDLFEIQSSQVALQKAQNADVRAFAQMMIDHHMMTTRDLTAAAQTAGVAAPPMMLPADKAAKLASLQTAPAGGFDAMYMREQVMGHQEALAIHRSYSRSGDQAALRTVAGKAVPIVQRHLTRAQELAGRS